LKKVLQWKAHQEAINQITLLTITQPLVLMTISNDKMVKFWVKILERIENKVLVFKRRKCCKSLPRNHLQ